MFYIRYTVVFIGCYFHLKSKVLHNDDDDDDRRGANAQVGVFKGSVMRADQTLRSVMK